MRQDLPSPPELCQAPLLESRAFEGASDHDEEEHKIQGYFDRPVIYSTPYSHQDNFSPSPYSPHVRQFAESLRRQTAPYSPSAHIRPGSARAICPPELCDMEVVATPGTPRASPLPHFQLFRPTQTRIDLTPEHGRPNHLQPSSASPRQVVWAATAPFKGNDKSTRPPLYRLHSGVIPRISPEILEGPPRFELSEASIPARLSSFKLSIPQPGERRFRHGPPILQGSHQDVALMPPPSKQTLQQEWATETASAEQTQLVLLKSQVRREPVQDMATLTFAQIPANLDPALIGAQKLITDAKGGSSGTAGPGVNTIRTSLEMVSVRNRRAFSTADNCLISQTSIDAKGHGRRSSMAHLDAILNPLAAGSSKRPTAPRRRSSGLSSVETGEYVCTPPPEPEVALPRQK